MRKIKDCKSITVELLCNSFTLAEGCSLFDEAIAKHPQFSNGIGISTSIVEKTSFESFVVKVQSGRESSLSKSEERTLGNLKRDYKESKNEPEGLPQGKLFFNQLLRKHIFDVNLRTFRYLDLRFILSIFSTCEVLFYQPDMHWVTDQRGSYHQILKHSCFFISAVCTADFLMSQRSCIKIKHRMHFEQ